MLAPLGAAAAARRQSSTTSRGTARAEKSRTVRRRRSSAANQAARRFISSEGYSRKSGRGMNAGSGMAQTSVARAAERGRQAP